MAEDLGEKTEEATPKRRQDAREKGQVAKSTDLAALVLLAVAMTAIAVSMGLLLERGGAFVRATFEGATIADPTDPGDVMVLVVNGAEQAMWVAGPILGVVMLAGAIAHFMQVGPLLAPKAIQPSLSKINPISGFRRIFGLQALVKAGLDILKVIAIVAVAVATLWQYESEIAVLSQLELVPGLVEAGWIIVDFTLRLLVVLLIIGILDFIWQRAKHAKDLRMSKQEVKDDLKNADGDPEDRRHSLDPMR